MGNLVVGPDTAPKRYNQKCSNGNIYQYFSKEKCYSLHKYKGSVQCTNFGNWFIATTKKSGDNIIGKNIFTSWPKLTQPLLNLRPTFF